MNVELLQLIERAFSKARAGGKGDRMTVAVLKNRLLAYPEFKPYSTEPFKALLLRDCGDALLIDDSTMPASVSLKSPPTGANEAIGSAPSSPGAFEAVRADLWRATMDYSSGRQYVWDTSLGAVRDKRPGEVNNLTLPTISATELAEWRGDFVSAQAADLPAADKARLDEWMKTGRASTYLPKGLIGPWNRTLREKVLKRLRGWFSEQGIAVPSDLLRSAGEKEDADDLRALLHRCVDAMTPAQLRNLSVPVEVVKRVLRKDD